MIPDSLEHFDNAVGALESLEPVVLQLPALMMSHFEHEREKTRKAVAASRAETAELDVPTKLPLLPFQKAGVAYVEEKKGRAIVGDEIGRAHV